MCEVGGEESSCMISNFSLLTKIEESQWVACGRKLRPNNAPFSSCRAEDEGPQKCDIEFLNDLPLELCDPMRRKITSLKPSLTPGAGTRIIRRRKSVKQDFMAEPVSDSEEAFYHWREAMRSMARLPEGIPPQFRRRIWLVLASHTLNSQHINWPRLIQTLFTPSSLPNASETDECLGRQIAKDLHRTGSGAIVGGETDRTSLKRVLIAYARWNRRVGYCQGFNILASVILNVMEQDVEDSLKVMIFLIDYVLPESYFARNLQALSVDLAVFRDLLALCQPSLAAHLQKLQLDAAFEAGSFVASSTRASIEPPLTDLFAIQWFVTLFSTSLPMSIVLRIWDAVLLEGSEVGIRAGLVVMDILSHELLQLPSADKFYSSMGHWMGKIAEGMGPSRVETVDFMRLVYDIAPLPWPRLGDLRKHYAMSAEYIDGRLREVISLPPPLLSFQYKDGYDEEARKIKTKWWQMKPKQALQETTKSLAKSREQSTVTLQRRKRVEGNQDTESAVKCYAQTSPSMTLEPLSDLFRSTERTSAKGTSDNINSDEDFQNCHQNHQQRKKRQEATPLAVDSENCTPKNTQESRRTSYHFDDSFLQTTNEWQRRNAAALVSEEDTSSNANVHIAPAMSSPPAPVLQRTLLSIVAEKRMVDPTSVMVLSSDEKKSSIDHPSVSLRRSYVLAKAITRDRSSPMKNFDVNHPSTEILPANYSLPLQKTKPSPSLAQLSPHESDKVQYKGSPLPPWAAAMAAIGAAPCLADRRPTS